LSQTTAQDRLRLKASRDFRGFCKHCVKIQDKDGKTVSFELNAPQLYILEKMEEMDAKGLPIRIIVLKSRQIGMSTFSQAWLAHKAFTQEGQNCLTIGQNLDMASNLFGKVEFMRKRFPEWMGINDKNTRKRTGRRISIDEPLNSLLYVETAENKDAGRSLQMRHVQATELPFWPDAKRTLAGALQSVPDEQGTSVIKESTAHGAGDHFHDEWLAAKLGPGSEDWNGYTAIFIPWFWLDEYTSEPREGELEFSKEHLALQEQYKLTDGQLRFYRRKEAELGSLVKQEYPFTDEEAFQYSGRPWIDPSILDDIADNKIKKPILKGMFKIEGGRPVLRDTGDGELWLWEKPKPNVAYTITADPSSGTGRDKSGLHIMKGLKQVASYNGKMEPPDMAVLIWRLAVLYNGAFVIPEVNSMGLGVMLSLTKDLGYTNVYKRKGSFASETERETDEFGFWTTQHTRMAVLARLYDVLRSGDMDIKCERTLAELRTFVYPDQTNDKPQAQKGASDDMVMSLALTMAAYEPGSTGGIETVFAKRPIRVSRKTGY